VDGAPSIYFQDRKWIQKGVSLDDIAFSVYSSGK